MKEIKINKPRQIHNLDKPGNTFDNIQLGDILQFTIPGGNIVQQKVINKKIGLIKTIDIIDGDEKLGAYDYWDPYTIKTYYSQAHLNEVSRIQQLAGIITEIKVVNPIKKKTIMTYNAALKISEMDKEIRSYINTNYYPQSSIMGSARRSLSNTNASKITKLAIKNNDKILLSLVRKYINYKSQFLTPKDEI